MIHLSNICHHISTSEWVKVRITKKAEKWAKYREVRNDVLDDKNNTKIKLMNRNRR